MRARLEFRKLLSLLALFALFGAAAACGSDDDTASTASEASADDDTGGDTGGDTGEDAAACVEETGTLEDGTLTIATDDPAFEPWFVGDPESGKGYESAVAYAVAEQLGFSEDQVTWTVVPFNNAYAPGDKDFDFDINQVSFKPKRDEAVDFSDGYYDVNQALVGFEDSPAADATSIEELQGLKLGAQIGTTSLDFINDVIQPSEDPLVYNDNAAAKAALNAEQIDGIVLDYPTAWYVSAVEIEGTTVIAQFPSTGEPEHFGMVFEEGNPLRECVNTAIATLEADGTLADLDEEWLSQAAGAPVIEVE